MLCLTAPDRDTLALRIFGSKLGLEYTGPQRYSALADDLLQLRIWHAQLHHLGGFGPEIYRVLAELAVPYDVTVHDYFAICPRINLMDGSERYCGEPEAATCNACIESNGTHESCSELYRHFGADVNRWRKRHGELLERARMVIAPSRDAGERTSRYFPHANIVVKPHPEPVTQVQRRTAPAC